MRVCREPCRDTEPEFGQFVGQRLKFVGVYPWVDEEHAVVADHRHCIALAELALADEHAVRDRRQHGMRLIPSEGLRER